MATLTTTKIAIAGRLITSYKELRIHQTLGAHHQVILSCRADVLEQFSDELIGVSKDFLGEVITISVVSQQNFSEYKELLFKGVITKVQAIKRPHVSGNLIEIVAMSSSILAEDGAHTTSYLDLGVAEILDVTYRGYDTGKLETSFRPRTSDTIHYSVQKRESNFAYTARLAATTNNWFYYDGVKLVFGLPSEEETNLVYGQGLSHFAISLEPLPNSFNCHTYDYLTGEYYQKNSKDVSIPPSGYHSLTTNKAHQLYAKTGNQYLHPYTDSQLQHRFERQVENHAHAIAARQVIASGVSDNPGVQLGTIINVSGYGRFRIISVTHGNIEGGEYKNNFEAIASDIDVYPLMNMFHTPVSTIEMGEIIDNVDPEGLSRVKVRFPFQEEGGTTTPWIPVVTPYAGADKGFHFIPEIGETVVCHFENNHAERPYVTGSIYHGQAQPVSYQSDANNIKAIKTRSGHSIELNDTQGGEMITITDKNSNIIRIDTATNNIEIAALENMTLTAKNIAIRAEENINMVAGKDFANSVAENYNVMTKNSTFIVEETAITDSKKQENVSDEIVLSSNKENLTLASGKTVDVQSKEKVKLF